MDDQRLDLSSLDPSKDELRWERMIRQTAVRGLAARRSHLLSEQIVAVGRPAAVMAASLALVFWSAVYLRGPDQQPSATVDSSAQLIEWANAGQVPGDAELETLHE